MYIGKSFVNSNGEETDKIQVSNSSTTLKWLSRREYTGFWITVNNGFVAVGLMNENTLGERVAAFSDNEDPYR